MRRVGHARYHIGNQIICKQSDLRQSEPDYYKKSANIKKIHKPAKSVDFLFYIPETVFIAIPEGAAPFLSGAFRRGGMEYTEDSI